MKPNLGKYILIVLLLVTSLWAKEDYTWSSTLSKEQAYVNEAIFLEYVCQFKDDGALYVIEFAPKSTKAYDIKLLKENETINNGQRSNLFQFVLFPKKNGNLELSLEALMRKTTRESIENTVIGRDNVEDTDFSDKRVSLKHKSIVVKAAPVSIVGEFELEVHLDKNEVKGYEPTHLSITIKGEGDLEKIVPFVLDINNTKVFSETPQRELTLTENGYRGSVKQEFALVGASDFTIPKIDFEYFDLQEQKVKVLSHEAISVVVHKGFNKEALLDEEPEVKTLFNMEYIYLFLAFIIGVLVGKFVRFKPKPKAISNKLKMKITQSKSKNELGILLVLSEETRFNEVIEKLETKEYTLAAAKKELLNNICH